MMIILVTKHINFVEYYVVALDNKTYGICEVCGEEISEARLKARPVTTLCIDCKKKQEMEEKVKGL